MFFDCLSEEAKRTDSKTKDQVSFLVSTMSGIVENAEINNLLTRKESEKFTADLEQELFQFMNK